MKRILTMLLAGLMTVSLATAVLAAEEKTEAKPAVEKKEKKAVKKEKKEDKDKKKPAKKGKKELSGC